MKTELGQVSEVKIVELIQVIFIRGDGTIESPIRTVKQYWTKDGKLVAEVDSLPQGGKEAQ